VNALSLLSVVPLVAAESVLGGSVEADWFCAPPLDARCGFPLLFVD